MARPRLTIRESRNYEFEIGWYFPDDGEFGGMLGETLYQKTALKSADPDERECAIAYFSALDTHGVRQSRGQLRLWWETRKDAQNALRAIKSALANNETPWPDWASKARGEGWKPPKGWKP